VPERCRRTRAADPGCPPVELGPLRRRRSAADRQATAKGARSARRGSGRPAVRSSRPGRRTRQDTVIVWRLAGGQRAGVGVCGRDSRWGGEDAGAAVPGPGPDALERGGQGGGGAAVLRTCEPPPARQASPPRGKLVVRGGGDRAASRRADASSRVGAQPGHPTPVAHAGPPSDPQLRPPTAPPMCGLRPRRSSTMGSRRTAQRHPSPPRAAPRTRSSGIC